MKTNFVAKNRRRCFIVIAAALGLLAGTVANDPAASAAELFDKLTRPFSKQDPDDPYANPKTGKTPSAAQEREKKSALANEMSKGRMQERQGDWPKARKTYQALLVQFPNDAEVRHRLGVVADQQRRFTEAQDHFVEALRIKPRDPEIHNDLGYNFFLQGKLDKAESSLTKATQIDPKNSRYRNNLGLVLGHKGKFPEAHAEFAKAGSEADAFYNLAFIYAAKDQPDKAKECFRRAVAVNPKHELSRKALQSFDQYDAMPKQEREARDVEALNSRGNLVPYLEGSEKATAGGASPMNGRSNNDSSVQRVSYSEAGNGSGAVSAIPTRQVSSASRAMQNQSRGLLDRNMSSKRDTLPPGNGQY